MNLAHSSETPKLEHPHTESEKSTFITNQNMTCKIALAKLKKIMYLINAIVIIAIIIITERTISIITYKDMFINAPVHPYFYLAGFFVALILVCLGLIAFENIQRNKILKARNSTSVPSNAPHIYLIGFIIGITVIITVSLEIIKYENNRILKELENDRLENNKIDQPIISKPTLETNKIEPNQPDSPKPTKE